MSRNSQTNGMDSIGKQVTLGGHSAVEQPADVPASEEGPGMGGAMLAMVACGAYPSVADAVDAIVRVTETIEPDAALAERYDVQYEKYRKLYPALKDVFPQLH